MPEFPKKLAHKIERRISDNALRKLPDQFKWVDFSSNDYLGLAKEPYLEKKALDMLINTKNRHGSTGSRLLSGNHSLFPQLEQYIATFYGVETALVFNSGYDANIGFFSSVPQRGDIIFYDELIHASIRDGIKMGNAKAYKFAHNSLKDLEAKVERFVPSHSRGTAVVYVVTESVFSMDGDSPDLKKLSTLCEENQLHLVVDEAHAVGVFGRGLIFKYGLQDKVFAQIVTFGKAIGCHGAAILGCQMLKEYLVNHARSFIYTTALSPHITALIFAAHQFLETQKGYDLTKKLSTNIDYFNTVIKEFELQQLFLPSKSAIQIAMIKGNKKAKMMSNRLLENGFDIRPILSPTVPKGNERLRFCLHAFNTQVEIRNVLSIVKELYG